MGVGWKSEIGFENQNGGSNTTDVGWGWKVRWDSTQISDKSAKKVVDIGVQIARRCNIK